MLSLLEDGNFIMFSRDPLAIIRLSADGMIRILSLVL